MASQSSYEVRDDRGHQRALLGVDSLGRPSLEFISGDRRCAIVLDKEGIDLIGSDFSTLIGKDVTRGDLGAMVREAVAAELAVSIAKVEEIARRCSEDARAAVSEIVARAKTDASTAMLQLSESAERREALLAQFVADVESRLSKASSDQVAAAKVELVETIRRAFETPEQRAQRMVAEAMVR